MRQREPFTAQLRPKQRPRPTEPTVHQHPRGRQRTDYLHESQVGATTLQLQGTFVSKAQACVAQRLRCLQVPVVQVSSCDLERPTAKG